MKLVLTPLEISVVRSARRAQELLQEKIQAEMVAARALNDRVAALRREMDDLRLNAVSSIGLSRGVEIPPSAVVDMSMDDKGRLDGKTGYVTWEDPVAEEKPITTLDCVAAPEACAPAKPNGVAAHA